MGDLEDILNSDDLLIGKRTKPRKETPTGSMPGHPPTMAAWVKEMDRTNGWPKFDERVKDFAKEFKLPYAKAVIYILFDVF